MYLGVDLGTSSIKILLSDNDGKIIASESCQYPLELPKENWSQQNPDDWVNGFKTCVKNLGKNYDLTQIDAMSFSGQMHGLVILDENDKVIRPAILWNDSRTVKECEYLNNVIGKDNLIKYTGNVALTGFTAPKLLWIKNNEPSNFEKIKKIMLPKDYLQYMITGNFASDVSDNSGTLYFDVKNKTWSQEMLNIIGINKSQLPKIYESVDVVGNVKKSLADELGMSTNTKVIIGGGDQAMGAVGTGTTNPNQVSISLGTSGVVFINSKEFVLNKNAQLHSFCNATGDYHLMGVTLCCAGSAKWWVEDVLHQTKYNDVYKGISTSDIDDNLLFLPYLMGERSPINDPNSKGMLYGINLMHNQQSMTKAIMEGICFSLKDCLNVANENGINPKFARVIGGGAKSPEWLQILSDILNLEIHTINTNEGGALGAIILCMVATNKFNSIDEACKNIIKDVDIYKPNEKFVSTYSKKFIKYKSLYETVKNFNK